MKGLSFLSNIHQDSDAILHLQIVLSDDDEEGNYMVVPVTTWREVNGRSLVWQDKSCTLDVGDHPFIRHKSWVYFAKAYAISFKDLFDGQRNGVFIAKERVRNDVLIKIQASAKRTDKLPSELKHFFNYF
jgi:hypothetical protein